MMINFVILETWTVCWVHKVSEFNKRVTDKDDMIVPVTVGDKSEQENDQPVTRRLIFFLMG